MVYDDNGYRMMEPIKNAPDTFWVEGKQATLDDVKGLLRAALKNKRRYSIEVIPIDGFGGMLHAPMSSVCG